MTHPLLTAATQAAHELRAVLDRHDAAWAAFLADMDAGEDAWDAYVVELGFADIRFRGLHHWAVDRIEGCDNQDPHPGCLCYECSEWYADDDHAFYRREPTASERAKLRAGLEQLHRIRLRALGG